MIKYHDLAFCNKLYAGRRRYLTQYVEKYPIPDLNKPECKEIINCVKKLLKPNISHLKIKNLKEKIEIEIENCFGIKSL